MSTVVKFLWALVVFVVTWFLVWALAYVLKATGLSPLVEVGAFLDAIDWLLGAVAGVLYFVTGDSWLNRNRL